MTILIGQSYFRSLDPKELQRRMPYPPLGALYVAAVLRQAGHDVVLFDAMLAEGPEEFGREMVRCKPDCVLLYDDEFNYLTKMCLSNMRSAAITMIGYARAQGIPVVVHSSDAIDRSGIYLKAGADAIIVGEGELTAREVMASLEQHSFTEMRSRIAGLRYLTEEGIIGTGRRALLEDLDQLPNPAFDLVAMDRYRALWLRHHGYFSMNISTTRGCPFHCNWCAKPIYGQVAHARAPQAVAAEMAGLKVRYGVDHIWITDDIFGLKPGWLAAFADACRQHEVSLPYKCLTRADLLLRDDTIRLLRETGCRTIWIGAESGSQRILDAMEKGTTVDEIRESTAAARAAGMEIGFFIQFGFLGEMWEDVQATRRLIRECLPDDIGISVSYPLPGTRFFDHVKEQLGTKTNWMDSDDLDLMFPGTYPRSFYKLLHRLVHAEFRLMHTFKHPTFARIIRLPLNLVRYASTRIGLGYYLLRKPRTPMGGARHVGSHAA